MENRKNWRIRYKTRHLKVLSVQDLLPHHATEERDDAAERMTIWWTSPPPILQIHSRHQVAMGTAVHVPLRCHAIIVTIFRSSGTYCMVSSDWDMALRCIFGPNFTFIQLGELQCVALFYWTDIGESLCKVPGLAFIVSKPRETHPRSEIANVPTSPCPLLDNLGCPDPPPTTQSNTCLLK